MRSLLVLIGLGLALLAIALGVRSGWFMRENPGEPINAAMRQALQGKAYQWTEAEQAVLARDFAGALETRGGARYLLLTPGVGAATPARGTLVRVHYTGWFLDGKQFDSSADQPGPLNFYVGVNKVIPGWDEQVLAMKKGEKRRIILPYWLAYGEKGIRTKIPGRSALIFEIELLDFVEAAPAVPAS
jgi:FKBP-type peptidyl-prolyl cis-trans isomerase